MKLTQIFTVVVFFVGDLVSANISEDPIFPNLKFVAGADGKTFFADKTMGPWLTSKAFCAQYGMKLAEITTENQWNALVTAYDSEEFSGNYWTGARDGVRLNQFAWDSTGTAVSGAFYGDEITHADPAMCIAFSSRSGGKSVLHNRACSWVYGYTLCEASAGPIQTKFGNV